LRLFWAAPLSGAACLPPVIANLSGAGADVNWVRPEHHHVTLAFLGSVNPSQLESACAAGRKAIEGYQAPASVGLGPLGTFPSWEAPKVLWASVDEKDALTRVAESLYNHLGGAGFRLEDRPFVPHVTLGRIRSGRGLSTLLERCAPWKSGEAWQNATCKLQELVLYESRTSEKGPEYTAHLRLAI
jgi:2'-5' RNA ligase